MEHTANSSPENKRYNDEAGLLDGLYEFHPGFFKNLSQQELQALKTYYLTSQDVPENIFGYRAELLKENPEIEEEARNAFARICKLAGIKQ